MFKMHNKQKHNKKQSEARVALCAMYTLSMKIHNKLILLTPSKEAN